MTKYSRSLGAEAGEWVDVFSLDEDSLETIPKPVEAVILLFPITEGVLHKQFLIRLKCW